MEPNQPHPHVLGYLSYVFLYEHSFVFSANGFVKTSWYSYLIPVLVADLTVRYQALMLRMLGCAMELNFE